MYLGHCKGLDVPGGLAIKVLHERKVRGKEEETLMREARIMTLASSVGHPCVAKLLGIVAQPGGKSANGFPLAYAMLLEYCPGGGLDRVLHPKGFFKTTDADGEVFIIDEKAPPGKRLAPLPTPAGAAGASSGSGAATREGEAGRGAEPDTREESDAPIRLGDADDVESEEDDSDDDGDGEGGLSSGPALLDSDESSDDSDGEENLLVDDDGNPLGEEALAELTPERRAELVERRRRLKHSVRVSRYLATVPISRRLAALRDICSALKHLHSPQPGRPFALVHRDLKPDNVLLSTDSIATARAVVSDYGLAKLVDSKADLWQSLVRLERRLGREERRRQRRAGGARLVGAVRPRRGSGDTYDSSSSMGHDGEDGGGSSGSSEDGYSSNDLEDGMVTSDDD